MLAAPSDLLVTLAGGKHVALLSTATAVAPFLRMVLVLVTPGNDGGPAAPARKPAADR